MGEEQRRRGRRVVEVADSNTRGTQPYQFSGGASNWTYRSTMRMTAILRRPPEGTKAKSAHDMGREYRIQKAKAGFAMCRNAHVLRRRLGNRRRVLRDAVRRASFREEYAALTRLRASGATLCNALDVLISLHAVDYKAAGLESIGLNQTALTPDRWLVQALWMPPGMCRVARRSCSGCKRTSAHERICVTHNAFLRQSCSCKRPDRSESVLDWEARDPGRPLMVSNNSRILGSGRRRFYRANHAPPANTSSRYAHSSRSCGYAFKSGHRSGESWFLRGLRALSPFGYRAADLLSLLHKQSRNPSVKNFWLIVHYLHWRARKIMKASR